MKDILFDTKEKRQLAISTFKDGMEHPFWMLMSQMLEADMATLKVCILAGVDEEGQPANKKKMDMLRDRLKVYQDLLDAPKKMIGKLTQVKVDKPNFDPYLTDAEIAKERRINS